MSYPILPLTVLFLRCGFCLKFVVILMIEKLILLLSFVCFFNILTC